MTVIGENNFTYFKNVSRLFRGSDYDDNLDALLSIFNGESDGTVYNVNFGNITANAVVGAVMGDASSEVYGDISNCTGFPSDLASINSNAGYAAQAGGEFKVLESTTPGQSVEINDVNAKYMSSTGTVFTSSTTANTSVLLTTADVSNPRWDLISLNVNNGTYTVTDGTAAAVPVQPSAPSGEELLAFIYRQAAPAGNTIYQRNILDVRTSSNVKNTDGHFKTNFSIDQKEDTENSEYDNQQNFQTIPFETKFDSLQEDKVFLHSVETVLVPADSHEITYTGAWNNIDSTNKKFGRAKSSATSGDTAVLEFSGVSCGVALETCPAQSDVIVELSADAGVTWTNKKIFSIDVAGGAQNVPFDCYSGLEYGDYQIRLTVGDNASTYTLICYFFYTTYMNQRPVSQYATAAGGATDINDVPPTTTLFDGTWTKINTTNTKWNTATAYSSTANANAEFKYYGTAIWVNTWWSTDSDCTITPLIDGSADKVKTTTFNLDTPNNAVSSWVRLDDGTLTEGWHTIKLTMTAPVGTDYIHINGWGYYSEKAPTTVSRSLICGKDSYLLGVDSSEFTYQGAGWGGATDSTTSLLRRSNSTTTQDDYVTIDTPDNENLKAIYGVFTISNSTAGCEVKTTLDAGSARYIDLQTDNYEQGSMIMLLYDSFIDGAIHNQALNIYNNTGTENLEFEGIIFEIGAPTEDDSMFCMPKWTRNNSSGNTDTCVSTAYRLDVYGTKTDTREGRKPLVHSGWFYIGATTTAYWRHGLGCFLNGVASEYIYGNTIQNDTNAQNQVNVAGQVVNSGDPGLGNKGNTGVALWYKNILIPNRVI